MAEKRNGLSEVLNSYALLLRQILAENKDCGWILVALMLFISFTSFILGVFVGFFIIIYLTRTFVGFVKPAIGGG